jgi:hypothetical protein
VEDGRKGIKALERIIKDKREKRRATSFISPPPAFLPLVG